MVSDRVFKLKPFNLSESKILRRKSDATPVGFPDLAVRPRDDDSRKGMLTKRGNAHQDKSEPAPTSSNSKINITGKIIRDRNKLNLEYLLQGDLSTVIIPSPANTPTRKHQLWQTTCFEFFLGIDHAPKYWEFNLSPTGDWNIYRFTDYRQGMQEEIAFTSLPFDIRQQANFLNINLEINLDLIIDLNTDLDIAISTVIKSSKEKISYWALTHPETKADFHNRDSFIIHI